MDSGKSLDNLSVRRIGKDKIFNWLKGKERERKKIR